MHFLLSVICLSSKGESGFQTRIPGLPCSTAKQPHCITNPNRPRLGTFPGQSSPEKPFGSSIRRSLSGSGPSAVSPPRHDLHVCAQVSGAGWYAAAPELSHQVLVPMINVLVSMGTHRADHNTIYRCSSQTCLHYTSDAS